MKKLILLILLILFLIPAAFFLNTYYFKTSGRVPYPYIVKKNLWPNSPLAEDADVVIVGDQLAMNLTPLLPKMIKSLSRDLRYPLKIFNWGKDKEGLHRTLAKLKSLKKIPRVIIYHGSNQELSEKKFDLNDYELIKKNFKKSKDEMIMTLLTGFPFLSSILFPISNYLKLEDFTEDNREFHAPDKQKQMEITYLLYENELSDLIELADRYNSQLIIINAPLNLDSPPREVCANSTNELIKQEQGELQELIIEKKIKEAFQKAYQLNEQVLGNAKNLFFLGQIAKLMGNINQAKKMLEKTTAFDCASWRSNIIFNAIMEKLSRHYEIPLIDFHSLVNKNFGKKSIFKDHIFPLEEKYDDLISPLMQRIRYAIIPNEKG